MHLSALKTQQLKALLFVVLIATPTLRSTFVGAVSTQEENPPFFFGVDVAYDNITATKEMADAIRPYSNLIIIGCSYDVDFRNLTRLGDLFDLCRYLYDRGFYFMIFENLQPPAEVVEHVRQYGDRFLGFYAYDEMGGRQLDQASNNPHFNESENYRTAADFYVNRLNGWLFNNSENFAFTRPFSYPTEFRLFTSDYALYWYDFKGGYDVVLTQIAWNYSRQLNMALCRGGATAQNKDWGTIICWKYTDEPYVESPQDLYDDLLMSYTNGAKYIVVFDTDPNWTRSILSEEHFSVMRQFWEYTQSHPRNENPAAEVAYVLPEGYGYGFRGPEDRIWGIWNADMTSFMLSISVNIMLEKYGSNVDIIYEDALQTGNTSMYRELIYWNDPSAVTDLWPTDWPIPTIYPTPLLSPTPTGSELPPTRDNLVSYLYVLAGGIGLAGLIATAFVVERRIRKSQST